MSRKKYSSTQKKRHPNISRRLRNHIQDRSLTEMYASLFEHNPDSIISLNLEGVILHINPSAEKNIRLHFFRIRTEKYYLYFRSPYF